MNEASKLIDSLWDEVENLSALYDRIKFNLEAMSPVEAGIIGKELLMRAENLSTPEFALAAVLASGGDAGNDGLVDFIDCVAILPFVRYSKIVQNHDSLIDDSVREEFSEFGFCRFFESRFESPFGEVGQGLLRYLVIGERPVDLEIQADIDPKSLFPRLYQRYGSALVRSEMPLPKEKVNLNDFFQ